MTDDEEKPVSRAEVMAASIAAVRVTAGQPRAEAYARALQDGSGPARLLDVLCGSEDSAADIEARAAVSRELAARPPPIVKRAWRKPRPTQDVLATVLRLRREGRATMHRVCQETDRTPEQVKTVLQAAGLEDVLS